MLLHIISSSPQNSAAFSSCLRLCQSGDAIVLIQDGVYAATQQQSIPEAVSVYVLQDDLDARGLRFTA